MRSARLVGHYFNVLGTASVLGMIVDPIFFDSLRIDFSFILAFWFGVSLLDGRLWSRNVSIVLFSLGILFAAGYLVSLVWATGPVSGGNGQLRTPLLASIHGGIVLLLLVPPWILLLLPGTKRWFVEQRGAPPSFSLNRRLFLCYVLAACVPIAGGTALERATRTAESSGFTTSFDYGERKSGMVAAQWMEVKETDRPLSVLWLAFAEADSYGSPRDGHVEFGPYRVAVPDSKPVRYIFSPPQFDESKGNVLLVRQDGTVIRLARRVTPEQLKPAREMARGARDFDQLRERLDSLLPSAAQSTSAAIERK